VYRVIHIIETEETQKWRNESIKLYTPKDLAASLVSQMGTATASRSAAKTLATAESCTGGQMAAALTSVAGSSEIFLGGIVPYAIAAKIKLLGISSNFIERHGVVSGETAEAMAVEAKKLLGSTFALSSTGIAGPSGGSPETPVGTVFIGLAGPTIVLSRRFLFHGSRAEITEQAVVAAFNLLTQNLN
jgi:PncC family amidohydrolase